MATLMLPVLTGTAGKVARWTARGLAVIGALLSIFIIMNVVTELRALQLPFVLDGAPFGTYEQTTQLNLLTFGAAEALFLVGAILAFRWEATAARILLVTGVVQLFLLTPHWSDPTFPRANLVWGLAIGVLPPLIIGGLLLAIRRASRPPHQLSRDQGGNAMAAYDRSTRY